MMKTPEDMLVNNIHNQPFNSGKVEISEMKMRRVLAWNYKRRETQKREIEKVWRRGKATLRTRRTCGF